MFDGATLVFVEVRYRASAAFMRAGESVDPHKCRRLTRAAELYLQRHYRAGEPPCRFDVIGISGSLKAPEFEWIKDAF